MARRFSLHLPAVEELPLWYRRMLVQMWWESETEEGQKASEGKRKKAQLEAELPDDMPDDLKGLF